MRLIDAEEVIKAIDRHTFDTFDGLCLDEDITIILEEIPTAQPERKKGKWIDEGFYADGHNAHAFRCSECGGHIIEYDADPFCRWCGADMRGEENATD